jgi:hypothetical protein
MFYIEEGAGGGVVAVAWVSVEILAVLPMNYGAIVAASGIGFRGRFGASR